MLETASSFFSTLALLGVALTRLVAPLFGYRWTRRRFGTVASGLFLAIIGSVCAAIAISTHLAMEDLAREGAWTAATLMPVHAVALAFPILLVVTVVWVGAFWTWSKMRPT